MATWATTGGRERRHGVTLTHRHRDVAISAVRRLRSPFSAQTLGRLSVSLCPGYKGVASLGLSNL